MSKLTIKEAKEKATKITGNIPTIGTLRNWVNKGLLSGTVDYINRGKAGGRIGLYPESLPIEIATAIDLKGQGYTIGEIAKVRKEIIKELRNMQNEITSIPELNETKLMENIREEHSEINKSINELSLNNEGRNELMEKFNLIILKSVYARRFIEFSQELNQVEEVKQ